MKIIYSMLFALILITTIVSVSAIELDREQKLQYGLSLYIKNISMEPSEIAPGGTAVMNFVLENVGERGSFLRDVRIKLDLPAQFISKDTIEKKIRELPSNTPTAVSFTITALPDTKIGLYKVPITLYYVNQVGTEYKENNTISLTVSAQPQIFVEIESTEIYKGNNIGKVSVKITNNGLADIKFLTVTLKTSTDYEILTADKQYVGDLDSDEYEAVDFKLKANVRRDKIILPLLLTYRDANNKEFSEEQDITLPIRSAREAGIQQSKTGLVIVVIILAIIAFFAYRNYKKKKKV